MIQKHKKQQQIWLLKIPIRVMPSSNNMLKIKNHTNGF